MVGHLRLELEKEFILLELLLLTLYEFKIVSVVSKSSTMCWPIGISKDMVEEFDGKLSTEIISVRICWIWTSWKEVPKWRLVD